MLGHGYHCLRGQPTFAGQTVPSGIGTNGQHNPKQDQGASRDPTFGERHREGEFGLPVHFGSLCLETTGDLVRIQPECSGIGA
jgi:hypothetical protein